MQFLDKISMGSLDCGAGVMLVPERKTKDGFEEHFGLNYLGHFLLTNLLLDTLKQSGTHSHNARIITVSSATHYAGKLHLDDLQSRYRSLFGIH
ncbi:hypothetical protein DV515_00003838 [Chloebia gouldiae]|uniref:Dehydrogenase/reductase SDR family member on chromosome X n=1 Tax=Chloebia gouldiae TaxID=44316 RepID=A0A3L8SUX7_CHLGU|nr:hypothetical protein DV515_00003838 [Chloebia gouldiae]